MRRVRWALDVARKHTNLEAKKVVSIWMAKQFGGRMRTESLQNVCKSCLLCFTCDVPSSSLTKAEAEKKWKTQRGHLKAKLKYTLRFVKTGAHETNINKNMLSPLALTHSLIVEHPKSISGTRTKAASLCPHKYDRLLTFKSGVAPRKKFMPLIMNCWPWQHMSSFRSTFIALVLLNASWPMSQP